jgi:RNA polymerase sigma-70 factor, ECF subfamily
MAILRAVPPDPEEESPDVRDDRVLMERLHSGDQEALGALLRRYWNPLVSYAMGVVGSRDDAEDVVQESILGIWDARDTWTPSSRLQGLLYRAVRNLALNARKQRNARSRRDWSYHRLRPAISPRTPHEVVEDLELERLIAEAVNALPPKRREVFVLSRYHGLTYGEIADALDISAQTVANQMSTALDDLRSRLEPALRQRGAHQLRIIHGTRDQG